MISEKSTVILTVDLPELGLRQGDIGAVAEVLRDGQAYRVKFDDMVGTTLAEVYLLPPQMREGREREIPCTRILGHR